jgi:hypothetical protein
MPPFDPLHKLAQLCRRHGLPEELGTPFLPLLERVVSQREDLRERALEFVGRRLAEIARERAQLRLSTARRNEACLRALAPLLHEWRPDRTGS